MNPSVGSIHLTQPPMSNERGYFAETSEAHFGRNDFHPFTRADLKKRDPQPCATSSPNSGGPITPLRPGGPGEGAGPSPAVRQNHPPHEGSHKWSGGESVEILDSTVVLIETHHWWNKRFAEGWLKRPPSRGPGSRRPLAARYVHGPLKIHHGRLSPVSGSPSHFLADGRDPWTSARIVRYHGADRGSSRRGLRCTAPAWAEVGGPSSDGRFRGSRCRRVSCDPRSNVLRCARPPGSGGEP